MTFERGAGGGKQYFRLEPEGEFVFDANMGNIKKFNTMYNFR